VTLRSYELTCLGELYCLTFNYGIKGCFVNVNRQRDIEGGGPGEPARTDSGDT